MLHHSEFGFIGQLLSRFERLNKICGLGSACIVSFYLFHIQLSLRDDVCSFYQGKF